jgi:hypothetical protein
LRVDRNKARDINHLLCIVCTVRGEGEKASRRNSSRLQHQSLYVSAVQTNKSTKIMNSAQKGVNKTSKRHYRRADKTNEGTYYGRNFHCEGGQVQYKEEVEGNSSRLVRDHKI